MQIYSDLPKLTIAEANRFWMPSATALSLARFSYADEGVEFGRLLNNLADRGYVDFEKASSKRTAPRLYCFNSAVKLAVIKIVCSSGRSYEFGHGVAMEVAALSDRLLEHYKSSTELQHQGQNWFTLYRSNDDGEVTDIRSVHESEFQIDFLNQGLEVCSFSVGEMLWRMYENYGEIWADDMAARGLRKPDRYRGCFPDGTRLDWFNRPGLTELERATRRLKSEQYIAELEGKPDS